MSQQIYSTYNFYNNFSVLQKQNYKNDVISLCSANLTLVSSSGTKEAMLLLPTFSPVTFHPEIKQKNSAASQKLWQVPVTATTAKDQIFLLTNEAFQ